MLRAITTTKYVLFLFSAWQSMWIWNDWQLCKSVEVADSPATFLRVTLVTIGLDLAHLFHLKDLLSLSISQDKKRESF